MKYIYNLSSILKAVLISIPLCNIPERQALAQDGDTQGFTPALTEKYQALPLGSVKPSGWLLERLQQDLNGFTGHLDQLVPDLIIKDDIYGKDRLTRKVKSKNLGALGEEGDWQVQFLWWNSETQSNWWDGYIRAAILTGDKKHLARVHQYIKRILATQDPDGYLGIYDTELRYKFDNENGELWSKATLLRGLLAWYEFTQDPAVLKAVERAVQNVMDNYPLNKSRPFFSVKPDVGGLSHGLCFIDVLQSLYRLNGNKALLNYATFLYSDFSKHSLNEDAQLAKLLDPTLPLKGHGVHTYEHIRAVAAASITGSTELAQALQEFLKKVMGMTTPTGGPVGDEWIGGKPADATNRGYEYCSLHELMHSYLELFLKTGDPGFASRAEHLFINAAQGARLPGKSSIAYLKSDNSYFMTGGLNGDNSVKTQTRYKYSPAHQDAAVCCVPNAGRITPYYIQHMWMKSDNQLLALLFGPSVLNTILDGKTVRIREETSFPESETIHFIVEGNDADFSLRIRKPEWAKSVKCSEKFEENDGFLVISKKWSGRQTIEIRFQTELDLARDQNGEYYYKYGPQVLAHPLKAKPAITRTFPVKGFEDLSFRPENLLIYEYAEGKPEVLKTRNGLRFHVPALNPSTKKMEMIPLEPVGRTILRQVTFKSPN